MSEYMEHILSQVGESVTVRGVSKTTNKWGDATETTTDATITAHIQVKSAVDDEVEEGRMEAGDIDIFIDPSDTNASKIIRGNRVQYNSEWYQIYEVIQEPEISDGEYHIEAHARRI